MVNHSGIVEGFYWTPECAVNGRFGEFSAYSRISLIEFMGKKKLNTYVYDPKLLRGDNYERAISKDMVGDPLIWKETFKIAKTYGVDFYWGIAPGRLENLQYQKLDQTLEYILDLGAQGFMLLFDDVPGAATSYEIQLQAKFASKLYSQYGQKIGGFCPGNYCGTKSELEQKLHILDENMQKEIPFIITGKKIWCDSISFDDLPRFGSRKIIIWDNWMASDTNDPSRLEFHPPIGRSQNLFDNIEGYLLNPCFPVERIIPMISAIGDIINYRIEVSGTRSALLIKNNKIILENEIPNVHDLIESMASDWGYYLGTNTQVMHKLLKNKVLKTSLAIIKEEYIDIIKKWPSLKPIFEQSSDKSK